MVASVPVGKKLAALAVLELIVLMILSALAFSVLEYKGMKAKQLGALFVQGPYISCEISVCNVERVLRILKLWMSQLQSAIMPRKPSDI